MSLQSVRQLGGPFRVSVEERSTVDKAGGCPEVTDDEGLERDKVTASEMFDVIRVTKIHMDICVLR